MIGVCDNEFEKCISAGRLQNEISLESLSSAYKRKVLDTISLLKFKPAVFDFDGTLTEFKYTEGRLLPCRDDGLYEYSKDNNLYSNVNILKTMQYTINELSPDDVYVLTVTVDTLKDKKEKCILHNFDNIKKENIVQVSSPAEKLEFLQSLYEKRQEKIIFVEDTAKTLLNAEEEFSFVQGLHISSLIP